MDKSLVRCLCLLAALGVSPFGAFAQSGKPNILVIFTDDVEVWNIGAYHRGMMGGSTPNIDRIAYEGALGEGDGVGPGPPGHAGGDGRRAGAAGR
jgi:hypothetical protein